MTSVKKDTRRFGLNVSQLSSFDREIRRFDIIMDLIQKHLPEDLKVWERIAGVRDSVFKLQQQLRGIEIEVFAAPWIDPEEEEDDAADSLLEEEEDE